SSSRPSGRVTCRWPLRPPYLIRESRRSCQMDARKMFLAFGVLALGAGLPLTVSRADAAPACGHSACSDEVAAAGLSGASRTACFKTAIAACRAGACSCTSTGSDACVCTPAAGPCSCARNGCCDPNTSCQTSDECTTVPNEFCFTERCPAIECPCCPVCGNGVCELDEGRCNCPQDCGSTGCFPGVPTCGDGFCQVN